MVLLVFWIDDVRIGNGSFKAFPETLVVETRTVWVRAPKEYADALHCTFFVHLRCPFPSPPASLLSRCFKPSSSAVFPFPCGKFSASLPASWKCPHQAKVSWHGRPEAVCEAPGASVSQSKPAKSLA
jgi:hypothetical protein